VRSVPKNIERSEAISRKYNKLNPVISVISVPKKLSAAKLSVIKISIISMQLLPTNIKEKHFDIQK
jgi:hypothetical protein